MSLDVPKATFLDREESAARRVVRGLAGGSGGPSLVAVRRARLNAQHGPEALGVADGVAVRVVVEVDLRAAR